MEFCKYSVATMSLYLAFLIILLDLAPAKIRFFPNWLFSFVIYCNKFINVPILV